MLLGSSLKRGALTAVTFPNLFCAIHFSYHYTALGLCFPLAGSQHTHTLCSHQTVLKLCTHLTYPCLALGVPILLCAHLTYPCLALGVPILLCRPACSTAHSRVAGCAAAAAAPGHGNEHPQGLAGKSAWRFRSCARSTCALVHMFSCTHTHTHTCSLPLTSQWSLQKRSMFPISFMLCMPPCPLVGVSPVVFFSSPSC